MGSLKKDLVNVTLSSYKISSEENAKELQCKVGDWIYTIEFPDGSDIQIAELYLEKHLGKDKHSDPSHLYPL